MFYGIQDEFFKATYLSAMSLKIKELQNERAASRLLYTFITVQQTLRSPSLNIKIGSRSYSILYVFQTNLQKN